jgi:hypothetical protein
LRAVVAAAVTAGNATSGASSRVARRMMKRRREIKADAEAITRGQGARRRCRGAGPEDRAETGDRVGCRTTGNLGNPGFDAALHYLTH